MAAAHGGDAPTASALTSCFPLQALRIQDGHVAKAICFTAQERPAGEWKSQCGCYSQCPDGVAPEAVDKFAE